MGSKEIFALRKQGHSEEALEMARAEFLQNKNDVWFLRAYAWPLYDQVKALVDRYDAKQLPGPALSGQFASYMNEFADMADPLRGDTAFSQMLRLAGKVSRDWDDFLLFSRWAGTDSFSEEDEKPFVTDDGKTIDGLKVRFTRAICREVATRASDGQTDPELINWGEDLLEQALKADSHDQWLNYYRSRLHLARGEQDQAIQRLMPVLHRQSHAAWPWAQLGEILETARPEDACTCLIHATRLARKEQEIAKVRVRLAALLARANRLEEAAKQANLAAQYRSQNEFRIPPPLQQLLASDWYQQVQAAGTLKDLPNVNAAARELLRDLNRPNLTYTQGVIDNINTDKALSHVATGVDTGFVLRHNEFPEVSNLAMGTTVEVGHAGTNSSAIDWRHSDHTTIPGLHEVVSGILTRHNGKTFAFVRTTQFDVFVPPELARSFTPGESFEVTCAAIRKTNKQGKTGWRALTFIGAQNSAVSSPTTKSD